MDIVLRALSAPTKRIVENTGEDGAVVVAELAEKGNDIGYDAATSKYVSMVSAGIIDPAKVSRTALQNAASVAGLLLTTDLMVAEYDQKADEHRSHQEWDWPSHLISCLKGTPGLTPASPW